MSVSSPVIREVRPEDREALVSLWARIFGDPPELAEAFLKLLPEMGSGCLAEDAGRVLGAAYLVDGFTLMAPSAVERRCGYLYAVAVEEDARGRGLGRRLSCTAAELGRTRGAEQICTLPAEQSLYAWYASILSLNYVNRRSTWSCQRLPPSEPLSTAEYGERRERLLAGRAHARLSPAALMYQQQLCTLGGGGFYAVGSGIYCAYRDEDFWVLPELLCPGVEAASFGGLETRSRPYLCSDLPFPEDLVWNLSFD